MKKYIIKFTLLSVCLMSLTSCALYYRGSLKPDDNEEVITLDDEGNVLMKLIGMRERTGGHIPLGLLYIQYGSGTFNIILKLINNYDHNITLTIKEISVNDDSGEWIQDIITKDNPTVYDLMPEKNIDFETELRIDRLHSIEFTVPKQVDHVHMSIGYDIHNEGVTRGYKRRLSFDRWGYLVPFFILV